MKSSLDHSSKESAFRIPIDATRLRQARLQKKLTLEEVSVLVSINKMTLLRYETGDIHTIAPERLQRMASVYETCPAYLCGIDPNQEFLTNQGMLITPINADLPSPLGKRLLCALPFINNSPSNH